MSEQLDRIERFGDVVIGPGLHRSRYLRDSSLRGQHHHGKAPRARANAESLNDLVAQQPRHHETAENEVEILAADPLQPSIAVCLDNNIEPVLPQSHFDESGYVRIVLDDEHHLGSRLIAPLVIDRIWQVGQPESKARIKIGKVEAISEIHRKIVPGIFPGVDPLAGQLADNPIERSPVGRGIEA